MHECMTVVGKVQSRDSGAPRESKISGLNPLRETRIREKMDWKRLEPGSLNLGVDCKTADKLLKVKEVIYEHPDEIKYPDGWQHIPKKRGGYKYYLATATVRGETQEVLVRRGAIEPLSELIELFAEVNLRVHFQLKDDDRIQVTVRGCLCDCWVSW